MAVIMAVLMFNDLDRVWPIILLAGVAGSLKAFFGTMSQAYAYDIVGPDRSLNGLALMSSSHRIGGADWVVGLGICDSRVGHRGVVRADSGDVHSGVGGADGDPGGGTVGGGASAACVREPDGLDEGSSAKTGCCSP